MRTDERIEEQLRDLFQAMVADEPPVQPAAAPHRRRVMRARQWWFAPVLAKGFAAAAVAGAVAVGAVVVPQLGDDARSDGDRSFATPAGPTATTTASPDPAPQTELVAYRDPSIGFELRYPASWIEQRGGSEHIAFVSPEATGQRFTSFAHASSCEPCPVGVPVTLVEAEQANTVAAARRAAARWRNQGADVDEGTATVAGRAAVSFQITWPGRSAPRTGEWCSGCSAAWFLVPWHDGATLDVRVIALDGPAWERDGARGLAIVESMRDLGRTGQQQQAEPSQQPAPQTQPAPGPRPTGHPVPEPDPNCIPNNSGAIVSSIECDASSKAVLRFAALRVEGSGAETWLNLKAKQQYDTNEGGLWLYAPRNERPYRSYFVTERVEMAGGAVRFTLEMNQGFVGDTGDRIRVEHVVVGDGTTWDGRKTDSGKVVRSATLVSEPTEP